MRNRSQELFIFEENSRLLQKGNDTALAKSQYTELMDIAAIFYGEDICRRDPLNVLHCIENSICVFFFWEMRGRSHNFRIHVSVSKLYMPRIDPHI